MRSMTKSGSNQSYREYGSATLAASVLILCWQFSRSRSANLDWPDTVAVDDGALQAELLPVRGPIGWRLPSLL